MCLSSVTTKLDLPKMMQFYKAMMPTGKYRSAYGFGDQVFGITKGFYKAVIPKRGWNKQDRGYTCGFHGWTSVRNAKSWRGGVRDEAIILCEGLVHTLGAQHLNGDGGSKVVVASTMRIIREVRDTPNNVRREAAKNRRKAKK